MTLCEQALALAQQGFHLFPITPGQKAPPLIADFPNKATRAPGVIADWWAQWPTANIGISTTHFRDFDALLVVDVDNKGVKHGDAEVLRLELDGWDLPDTYIQRTPTGGRHLVYRVSAPVRQGANILGPGLDIRSRGGYIVGVGSEVAAGVYTWATGFVADAPDWLVARCGEPRGVRESVGHPPVDIDQERASQRVYRYLTAEAPIAVEGQGGDTVTYKVACRVKDLGVDAERAYLWMLEHWNPRCDPPWASEDLRAKVDHAYRYGADPIGVAAPEVVFQEPFVEPVGYGAEKRPHPIEALNREYAFVIAGGGAHILWETRDVHGNSKLEHLTISAFHAKFANVPLTIGKKTKAVSEWWIEDPKRRSYDGIVFMPGQGKEIRCD